MASPGQEVVELNVGGVYYTTTLETLGADANSVLTKMFAGKQTASVKDSKGRHFIDRDGVLFRYILDYLRNGRLFLPDNFHERERLRNEAEFFRLSEMISCLDRISVRLPPIGTLHLGRAATPLNPSSTPPSTNSPRGDASTGCGYITVGYRGTFAFGRDGLADVKFRKISRILVAGRVNLCREVFGETLNESRDPDRGISDRYTSRFFLKHTFLEQSFDMLGDAGFIMCGACASGTNSACSETSKNESEENKWLHYNEFVFYRP